ncbi:MAG: amidohydrolase family protein [Candidatus Hodarchaeota archaeon]
MRIDFHYHVSQTVIEYDTVKKLFKGFEGYGFYERILKEAEKISSIETNDIIEKTLYHIKKAQIDKVVLLPVSAKENQLVKKWVEYAPDIFIPFYNPPEKPKKKEEIIEELEKVINEIGIRGFKVMLSFREKQLNDKLMEPVLEVAQKHKCVILMHTGWPPPATRKPVLTYANPLYLDEYLNSFPKVNFVLAHMGFPFSDIAIALATQYYNVYLDISNLTFMAPYKLNDLLLQAKDVIGTHKILFGTDAFVPEIIEIAVNYFDTVDYLSEEDIDKILGLNAAKLLKI